MAATGLAPIRDLPGIEFVNAIPRSRIKEKPDKCQFEKELEYLGLAQEPMWLLRSARDIKHRALRLWCKQHAHRRYVPTELLTAWGINVETYFSGREL